MAGEQIPSLIMTIVDELRARGILITSRPDGWCVNFRAGGDATAYVTDDLQDAFEHGRAMTLTVAAPSETGAGRRRKWRRRPINAKAARRAFIRAHNRRMRGRALRDQRREH
ncbi:MAG TPA: hypothetical protein VNF04_13110 [Stellaceae bacterium]|nr:hypothetical protein [Stellaceae bacterium]